MTFDGWFDRSDGEWPYPEQLEERYYEGNLDPDDIRELMREAYEAGYKEALRVEHELNLLARLGQEFDNDL